MRFALLVCVLVVMTCSLLVPPASAGILEDGRTPVPKAKVKPPRDPEPEKRQEARLTRRQKALLVLARRRAKAARIAKRYVGVPYVWGAASPRHGFDCSGLLVYVMARVGIHVPHYTGSMLHEGVAVPDGARLRPGDALFPHPGHVVLYLGRGRVIEAPRSGLRVRIRPMRPRRSLYAIRRFTNP